MSLVVLPELVLQLKSNHSHSQPDQPKAGVVATSEPTEAAEPIPSDRGKAEQIDSPPSLQPEPSPCEQDCQRRRMAEAVEWQMIVEGCRSECEHAD